MVIPTISAKGPKICEGEKVMVQQQAKLTPLEEDLEEPLMEAKGTKVLTPEKPHKKWIHLKSSKLTLMMRSLLDFKSNKIWPHSHEMLRNFPLQ